MGGGFERRKVDAIKQFSFILLSLFRGRHSKEYEGKAEAKQGNFEEDSKTILWRIISHFISILNNTSISVYVLQSSTSSLLASDVCLAVADLLAIPVLLLKDLL